MTEAVIKPASLFDRMGDPIQFRWNFQTRSDAQKFTIIVPVYGALRETLCCLHSILSAKDPTAFQLVVIDDQGPVDAKYTPLLEKLASENLIVLRRNKSNFGFVGTVNSGMLACEGDVLLLNSDTIVPDFFLKRMVDTLEKDETIASLTPFSNNATILSYPVMNATNDIRTFEEFLTIDSLFEACETPPVELPVSVGFCMLIRRSALNEVGLFDEALFGIGYGEESDWCMRAQKLGWKHRSVNNLFVYHLGSVSFSERTERRQLLAAAALTLKHPEYFNIVGEFCSTDGLRSVRREIDIRRLQSLISRSPVVLHICHRLEGGTMTYIESLANLLSGHNIISLLAKPTSRGELQIIPLNTGMKGEMKIANIIFNCGNDTAECLNTISSFDVKLLHVHSLIGFSEEAATFIKEFPRPKIVTLHDYSVICPQINLLDRNTRYCGLPKSLDCNKCLVAKPSPLGSRDITEWRRQHLKFLQDSDAVVVPSQAAKRIIQTIFSDLRVDVIENPSHYKSRALRHDRSAPRYLAPQVGSYKQIAVLGRIHPHKGEELIRAAAQDAFARDLPIQYLVFGSIGIIHKTMSDRLVCIGEYEEDTLRHLLDSSNCQIGFLASIWPETFSYVLSEILHEGLYPVVLNYGAPSDRLRDIGFGSVLPRDISPMSLNDFFLALPLENINPPAQFAPNKAEGILSWPVYQNVFRSEPLL